MIPHPLQAQVSTLDWQRLYAHLTATGKPLTPNLINQLLYIRGYHDFEFFAKYFFAHHCRFAFSAMHHDFCKAEADPQKRGRREAIAAPRGHAKTTFKSLIKPIHAIVYGYEPFIMLISHSASEVKEKVANILDELSGNQRLINVYGSLAPKQGAKGRFITQNGILVLGKSKGQQVRGLNRQANRPTLIICDDIESPEGVLSPEQRQKTRNWFLKDVLKCGQIDGSTNVTVVGTCLHSDSLLSELLRSPGWQSKKYQAVLSFSTHPELWEDFRNLYTDLSNPHRLEKAAEFLKAHQVALYAGTQVLWPEGESYGRLMRMKIDEGVASFSSEKQNDPYDPERQLFNMDIAKRVRLEFEGKTLSKIHWLDGSEKVVPRSQIQRIIAFHDPALGKKPGQHSEPDYAAIVVVAQDKDGFNYCLDAWIEKVSPSAQIERALLLHDKWGFDTLYLEENHFQVLLKESYHAAQEKKGGRPFPVVGVHQHANKIMRISTLEPEITNGYLLFAESVSPRLIDQLILFPTSYDDGPDALQGAVEQLKSLTTQQIYERFYC